MKKIKKSDHRILRSYFQIHASMPMYDMLFINPIHTIASYLYITYLALYYTKNTETYIKRQLDNEFIITTYQLKMSKELNNFAQTLQHIETLQNMLT